MAGTALPSTCSWEGFSHLLRETSDQVTAVLPGDSCRWTVCLLPEESLAAPEEPGGGESPGWEAQGAGEGQRPSSIPGCGCAAQSPGQPPSPTRTVMSEFALHCVPGRNAACP